MVAKELYELLMGNGLTAVFEDVSAGNFWVGYFTYRLMFMKDFWTMGKFKRGTLRPLEFRVLEKTAVRITIAPNGRPELYIDGKKIRNAKVMPEFHSSLMRLATPL